MFYQLQGIEEKTIFSFLHFDSADGEYAVTTMTKAILHSDGHVKW